MIKEIIIITIIIEILTIIGRVIFGSIRNIYKRNKKILKVRIHHGYTGLFLVILSFFSYHEVLLIIGMSLFLSDLIHHFIVLKTWTGKTEFP